MTKRKAARPHSRLSIPVVVADATEVSVSPGALVIRTGSLTSPPTVAALPAEILDGFLRQVQAASRAAEEDYWRLIPAFRAGARSEDNTELARAKEQWLRAQPWKTALDNAGGANHHPLFLVEYAGHVGLVAAAPFTRARKLVIFDPLQLHRLAPTLLKAASGAAQSMPGADPHVPVRLARALQVWTAMPWPATAPTLPTQQQAEAVISGLRTDFLRRPPFVKER
ncbi:hypothetical protein ABZV65_32000 [Streptomyces bauhiniae]|uniref:hypothetical protein n=1 Tax=Streptomyces bauhiniae TaxID=2340725 RepID=UPI0033ACAE32